MRTFLISVSRNPISLFGAVLTTVSGILILTLVGVEVLGHEGGAYIGILAFLVLPGVFVVGLVLIPFGVWFYRRRARAAAARGQEERFPVIDLNHDRTRNIVMFLLIATSINVVILALATYKGVEVMESTEFCGTACHTVMSPEFTTYQLSPHARVKCVSCHIGPGADWFVKSKLSGSWQLISVALDLYPRPIGTPVHNLRPARETCEQCHWPTKFVGDKLKVITDFAEDEANTEMKTVLVLRVGGSRGDQSHGIHWHVDPGVEIRYRSDETREIIYEVEMTVADGTVKTYTVDGVDVPEEEKTEWRTMDCVDCHNRPSHVYRLPENEINAAMLEGRIDDSLPFVRREGLRSLRAEYLSHEAASAGISEVMNAFYRENYPEVAAAEAPRIEAAARELATIYNSNVFPHMAITWGTYPNHIGHEQSIGCFRCHDEEHSTPDGETISQDCFTCHALLAMEEEEPAILADLEG